VFGVFGIIFSGFKGFVYRQKKGREPPLFSAHRGTAKHPSVTEIARRTHPWGASTETISLHSKNWRFSMREILATQYFMYG
jgi:hypothetical protein